MNIPEFEKEIEKSYLPQFPRKEFKTSLQSSFQAYEKKHQFELSSPGRCQDWQC